MDNYKTLKVYALSLPETSEQSHFEKTSFRVKKKIFVTYETKANQACVKLSVIDQDVFSLAGNDAIYPVPNKWGQKGWTLVELEKVGEELLKEVVLAAYCEVAPKKLAGQLHKKGDDS